jgi:hypothetical protein
MKLSEEQRARVQQKLAKNLKACLHCGAAGRTLMEQVFEIREFNKGAVMTLGGDSANLPLVAILCDQCGLVTTHAALLCGLKPADLQ